VGRTRDELAREVWEAVAEVFMSNEMQNRFHRACDALDLPHPGSLKALMMLPDDGASSMREMAELLRCDPSYVTALTDALEDRGYAERRPSRSDRRVKLLHLTAGGADARGRARDIIAQPPAGLMSLSTTDLRELARLVAVLRSASDEPVGS
jgi:DNA-binding MarR family transcriptional regulator